jgi:hypothetical protein
MFEINIDNNSSRISLARAAQLTGYHQDYLGQLCRLGKLPAEKVGRNWFTSTEALNNLFNNTGAHVQQSNLESAETTAEDFDIDERDIPQVDAVTQPVISPNITVTEMDGFPVRIVTIPTQVRHTNNVQNILTNARIESLQNEVLQLRQLLSRLMEEVKTHAGILESQAMVSRAQDSLKHSYVSNFDFALPAPTFVREPQLTDQRLNANWTPGLSRRYELADWFAVVAAIAVVAFVGYAVIAGNFFGSETQTQTVYSHPTNTPTLTTEQIQPSVAGAETPTEPGTLPTDSAGELIPNVIQ